MRSRVFLPAIVVCVSPLLVAGGPSSPDGGSDAAARLRRGETLDLTQGPTEDAAAIFREIAADARVPGTIRSRAILRLARWHLQRGDPARALAEIEKLGTIGEVDEGVRRIAEAMRGAIAHENDAAIRPFDRGPSAAAALASNPEMKEALRRLIVGILGAGATGEGEAPDSDSTVRLLRAYGGLALPQIRVAIEMARDPPRVTLARLAVEAGDLDRLGEVASTPAVEDLVASILDWDTEARGRLRAFVGERGRSGGELPPAGEDPRADYLCLAAGLATELTARLDRLHQEDWSHDEACPRELERALGRLIEEAPEAAGALAEYLARRESLDRCGPTIRAFLSERRIPLDHELLRKLYRAHPQDVFVALLHRREAALAGLVDGDDVGPEVALEALSSRLDPASNDCLEVGPATVPLVASALTRALEGPSGDLWREQRHWLALRWLLRAALTEERHVPSFERTLVIFWREDMPQRFRGVSREGGRVLPRESPPGAARRGLWERAITECPATWRPVVLAWLLPDLPWNPDLVPAMGPWIDGDFGDTIRDLLRRISCARIQPGREPGTDEARTFASFRAALVSLLHDDFTRNASRAAPEGDSAGRGAADARQGSAVERFSAPIPFAEDFAESLIDVLSRERGEDFVAMAIAGDTSPWDRERAALRKAVVETLLDSDRAPRAAAVSLIARDFVIEPSPAAEITLSEIAAGWMTTPRLAPLLRDIPETPAEEAYRLRRLGYLRAAVADTSLPLHVRGTAFAALGLAASDDLLELVKSKDAAVVSTLTSFESNAFEPGPPSMLRVWQRLYPAANPHDLPWFRAIRESERVLVVRALAGTGDPPKLAAAVMLGATLEGLPEEERLQWFQALVAAGEETLRGGRSDELARLLGPSMIPACLATLRRRDLPETLDVLERCDRLSKAGVGYQMPAVHVVSSKLLLPLERGACSTNLEILEKWRRAAEEAAKDREAGPSR